MSVARVSTDTGAAGLIAIAGVHALWATGSSWPLRDRAALADAVVGRAEGKVPSAGACVAVAGLLGAAAGFVGGYPKRRPALRRAGALGVVLTLATRGGLGLAGLTAVISPGSSSPRFRALDRRFYSPLCLALATLALPALAREPAVGLRA